MKGNVNCAYRKESSGSAHMLGRSQVVRQYTTDLTTYIHVTYLKITKSWHLF